MMRWRRKATQVDKDSLREEDVFLNAFPKRDALREERDPHWKGHSEGGKQFCKIRFSKKMRWGRKETQVEKDTLMDEN